MSVIDKSNQSNNDPPQTPTGTPGMNARTNVDNRRGFVKGGGQRRGNRSKFGFGAGAKAVTFKGETSGLNGNVFQLQEESKDPGQFRRTMDAMERYANKTFDCDFRKLFDKLEMPTLEKPKQPVGDDVDEVDKQVYHEEVKQYVKEKRNLKQSTRAMFAVVWGQCSPNVVTKLTQMSDIEVWKEEGECSELLKAIQSIIMKYDHQKHVLVTLFRQMRFFYGYRQKDNQDLHKYFEVFEIMVDNIDHIGGSFVHPKFTEELMEKDKLEISKQSDTVLKTYEEKAKEKLLAIAFLMGGRFDVYSDLVTDLENDFLKGQDSFPDTVTESYHLMANYGLKRRTNFVQHKSKQGGRPAGHQGIGFMQNASSKKNETVSGTDGIVHERITCFRCQKMGHYSDKCPMSMLQCAPAPPRNSSKEKDVISDTDDNSDNELGFGFVQTGYTMTQQGSENRYHGIDNNWILLDTQSNIDIFCNRGLLKNVRKVPDGNHLVLRSNGGSLETDMIGDVRGYGTVWYHPDSLANILSFANVRKKFNVHMDTGPKDPAPSISVTKTNGDVMRFDERDLGLYVHDALKRKNNQLFRNSYNYVFISTISNLEQQFTKREVEEAKQARLLYVKLGRPSKQNFKRLLNENFIRNCPITSVHVDRAWYIYGEDIANLKGKTTRTGPKHVGNYSVMPVPEYIKTWHNKITLCIDIFFVNNIPFFHTISRNLHFRTVETLSSRTYKHILSCLQNVFDLYESRGFTINFVHGDPEFQNMSNSFRPANFIITGKNDHVPEVERSIRTIKERCRSTVHGLPFPYYTKLMISCLVYESCRLLNILPTTSSVSRTVSPLSIVCGILPPSFDSFSISFGTYVQTHDNPSISNTNVARTTGAIALRPVSHQQNWYFMSLLTGGKIIRSKWTCLPISQDVINRVSDLAISKNQPKFDPDEEFTNLVASEGADIGEHNEIENPNIENPNIENPNIENPNIENPNIENPNDNNNANVNANNDDELNQVDGVPEYNNITDNECESNANSENEDENNENDLDEIEHTNDDDNDDLNLNNDYDNNEREKEDDEKETEMFADVFASNDIESNIEEQRNIEGLEKDTNQRSVANKDVLGDQRSAPENNDAEGIDDVRDQRSVPENNDVEDVDAAPVFNPVAVANQSNDDDGRTERLRYNLRKRIKNVRDDSFNKKNFNFLTLYSKQNRMRYSKRPKNLGDHISSYNHALARKLVGKSYNQTAFQIGTCLSQMSAKKGIKMFGNRAIEAMTKEYKQLDDLQVFTPRWEKSLSLEEKKKALHTIDLIKEKRSGLIKGRTVVDGRAQRDTYSKEDTSSPALSIDSFVATAIIDAYERRHVAVCDIAGAFLKADQPDYVILKLTGHAVEAVVNANREKYERFVKIINGVRTLYLQLLKAMYGTLTAPLLWYQMFVEVIKEFGFIVNPYDECVANKMVNGNQFTICWYVDDLKLSHADENVVMKMIKRLENKFGKMTVSTGTKHTYLGVEFELKNGKVHICMKEYLRECVEAFGEAVNTSATTPANKGLFEVNDESEILDERRSKIFHHIVQKLLHVCKRGRLDLQVSIAFLCTRVKCPHLQDWVKLKRVLQYVNGTINMERIVSLANFDYMHIYVDGSHATHINMRGHTGGCIVMGDGVVHARSSKQGLNSKSSTETEMIAASDYLPYALWLIYFYGAQGYKIAKSELKQDNQSTMRWLKNGRRSSGKQSRHVNIRFFWVADILREHRIAVEYCSTHIMLGDFFTKPLQGSLFRLMRDVVQGLRPVSDLKENSRLKENRKIEETDTVKGILLPCRKERVGEYETSEGSKRVSFGDCGKNSNLKKEPMKKTSTYADIVRDKPTCSKIVKK